jgi:hypothetical protein
MLQPPDEPGDDVLRVLALLAQTGAAHGARPSPQELQAIFNGRLSRKRRLEVESHVAHDPTVFADFVAAVRANATAPLQRRPIRRPSWLQSLSAPPVAFTAAAVALITMALFIPLPPRQSEVSERLTGRNAPSVPAARETDWARRAFRYGFEHSSAIDRLTGSAGDALTNDCTGDDCGSEMSALVDLGVAVGKLNARCGAAPGATQPLPGAEDASTELKRIGARLQQPAWRARALQVARALQRPANDACGVIAAMKF